MICFEAWPHSVDDPIFLDQKAHFCIGANMALEWRIFLICTVQDESLNIQSPRTIDNFLSFIDYLMYREMIMSLCMYLRLTIDWFPLEKQKE